MPGNGPDRKNREDRVEQCEKQTAIEGGSRPERRRRPQPEGVGEERPVGIAGVPKEAVNPVEKPGEPLGVETRRNVALGQAVPDGIVGLPLGWLPPVCAEDEEVAPIYEAQDQGTNSENHRGKGCQCRSPGKPSQ